jgi:uncharacterized protein (DUF4415 family)
MKMNDNNRLRHQRDVIVEVTEEDHRREISDGVKKEHALKPGRHVFRRGGFKERHPEFSRVRKTPVKVRVNIYLDLDIVNYFKELAKSPTAAGYQTQINSALRSLVARNAPPSTDFASLVDSDEFIAAVAARVRKRPPGHATGKKISAHKTARGAKRT